MGAGMKTVVFFVWDCKFEKIPGSFQIANIPLDSSEQTSIFLPCFTGYRQSTVSHLVLCLSIPEVEIQKCNIEKFQFCYCLVLFSICWCEALDGRNSFSNVYWICCGIFCCKMEYNSLLLKSNLYFLLYYI